ncbi:MAG: extracellular solute-binding protein [Clostridiales bacterium]|nr:extracellular solute-binding protein [Clostridiales bacterium]
MRKTKRILSVFLLVIMVVASLSACGGKNEDESSANLEDVASNSPEATKAPEATTEPEATPTPEPIRDLGGINIIVGDWWTTDGPADPKTQKEADTLAYREKLQEDHNFTLTQTNLSSYNEYKEIFLTSTMAGAPEADIFIMDAGFVPEPMKQGLLYPLNDLPSFGNFEDKKWNKGISEAYSQNGKVYAFSEEGYVAGLGVFWNKRIFEEAGLESDLLYDLQAKGEWTWDKFAELAKLLTKDNNNDGVTDIYGIATWQREIVKAAVFSNGSDYVRFNEDTGRYENNQMHDDVLAAIELAVDLYKAGTIAPQPEGAVYTYFVDTFATSQAAMCPAEWYRNTSFQNMEDDWGFVFFPVGPGPNAKMQTMFYSNPRVMPANLNPGRADDVAFAYSAWVSDVPGYEEDDSLVEYYSVTRDARVVDETIRPMLDGQGKYSLLYMVQGLSFRHGANEDNGGLGELSAIEIAEAASAIYESIINDFYEE